MPTKYYSAGLCFITIGPPSHLAEYDRVAVNSHATKAGKRRRQKPRVRSWIAPDRELAPYQHQTPKTPTPFHAFLSSWYPQRLGASFSGIQLPTVFEPHMIENLTTLIDLNRHGQYPYEICLDVHVSEKGWFPYLIGDICCLHSLLFSAQILKEGICQDQLSLNSYFHYSQTLRLLQDRLYEFDRTSAISDSTIMVITTLAAVAELSHDFETMVNHVKGLAKIVELRGGLRELHSHNNMQVKVCRTDISYALMTGNTPLLFDDNDISWACFIAGRDVVHCNHEIDATTLVGSMETALDTRLENAFKDVHAFACLSNLAYQTTRKLSPELYNEMMVSILYRLTKLYFDADLVQEVARLGLLVFASTIFIERQTMQRQFMKRRPDHLLRLYNDALCLLRNTTIAGLPKSFLFWSVLLLHMISNQEPSGRNEWRELWLDEIILDIDIGSWDKAKEIVRCTGWVDFVHESTGKKVFENAIRRLGWPVA